MNWKDYEKAVSEIYSQLNAANVVRKDVRISDRKTGGLRQVDIWVEAVVGSHLIKMLIDAKFHKDKINVKTVEEVGGLADAVGADKAVIVCANGWTTTAEKRATGLGIDMRLLSVEKAREALDPNLWELCQLCKEDFIILNSEGISELKGLYSWWLAGTCKGCGGGLIHCQNCGEKAFLEKGRSHVCSCGHVWKVDNTGHSVEKLVTQEK